ncbi:MAG: DNA-3-methyladenine glycosylase [Owenweeksia sp.]|nr:DNA-3-methyladenine glycosylase [Owenweeksia sp.]
MHKIPLSYYQQANVVTLAKNLLGKRICSLVNDNLTAGIISETEAYSVNDKACHAYQGKRTPERKLCLALVVRPMSISAMASTICLTL